MQTYFQVTFQCSKAVIFVQSNTVGLREPDTGRVDRLVWASRESTIQNVFPACKTSCHPAENVNETPVDWSSLSCPSCPVAGFFNTTFALFTFQLVLFSEVSRVHHFCLALHLHIHLKSQYIMLYCNSFSSSSFSSFPVVSFPGISVSYERVKNEEDLYEKSMTLYLRKNNTTVTRYYYAQLRKLLTFTF